MSEAAPILAARAVRFRYPDAPPLFDDFSIGINEGEFVSVLGPNGSGKTTLLRLLSGILAPEGGDVVMAGQPVLSLRPRQRARLVAVVLPESSLLFDFSVLEVVLMGRAPHLGLFGLEGPADFAAARAALSDVDLADHQDKRLRELSSGERQRALIARALAQQPRLLLLDEPTAFLDLKHRLQIYDILRRLNRDRRLTVVTTSHDLNLAARYGSRLIVLRAGRLAADGVPVAVLNADLLRSVYDTEARVEIDPGTGAPYVVPIAPIAGGPREPGQHSWCAVFLLALFGLSLLHSASPHGDAQRDCATCKALHAPLIAHRLETMAAPAGLPALLAGPRADRPLTADARRFNLLRAPPVVA